MDKWYAVMKDREDSDWGTGSYKKTEAMQMAAQYREDGQEDAYIAVIENDTCIDEIHDIEPLLKIEDVAQALALYDSMEQNGDMARYFLHIKDNGDILPTLSGADASFYYDTDVSDLDGDWRDEFEMMDNSRFMEVCENLRDQALEYLYVWSD